MPGIAALVEATRSGGYAAQDELRSEVRRLLEAGVEDRAAFLSFLRTASPREWFALDESMRAYCHAETTATWKAWWTRVRRAVSGAGPAAPSVLVAGIAAMDRDGRVREAAVKELALEADPLAGPFLSLRTTDWVAPVAERAVASLGERLGREPALLIASAPLLFALSDRQRRSGIERIVLERAAADAEVRTALLASSDRRTRRSVLAHEPALAAATLEELIELARSDADVVVASTAGVEAVARIARAGAPDERLAPLLAGPALLRRAVLDALAERGEGGALPERKLIERHLFDRSPLVREAAQRATRRNGGDPAAVYRAALARSERVPIAITELATLGQSSDHAAILELLRSADAAVRRAAAGTVKWIAGDRLVELLEPLLRDPSASVTRRAERGLRAQADELDGARLWELAAAPRPHNRRAAHWLLRRRTAAERLESDFLALADADESLRQEALIDLRAWLDGKAASAPRGDLATRRRLGRRLAEVEHQLAPEDARLLRFHAGLDPQGL